MTKLKNIEISGIRGIRDTLSLNLNTRSILIYGDNGTGKSSLTDSFEWFYNNHIGHLSNEEISGRGREALRNLFMPENDNGYIHVSFEDNSLDAKKSIDNSKAINLSNRSVTFNKYIDQSRSENLILRHSDLIQFIIASKTEKLNKLQEIIGFSEVANLRALLKKISGRIKRTINSSDFENRKKIQQLVIRENLGRHAYSDEQLIEGINELIKPLELNKTLQHRKEIQSVLTEISSNEDSIFRDEITLYGSLRDAISELKENAERINSGYENFYNSVLKVQKDPEKIKNIHLLSLLKEGLTTLKKDVVKENHCPLCLQEKSKIQLIQELNLKIEELEEFAVEKNIIEEQGKAFRQIIQTKLNTVEIILQNQQFNDPKFNNLKQIISTHQKILIVLINEIGKDVSANIKEPADLRLSENDLKILLDRIGLKISKLTASNSSSNKFSIYTKLFQTINAYNEYDILKKQESHLQTQQVTFELLFEEFIKRQEDALHIFLTIFSREINDYYISMNPNEKIENIKLIPLTRNKELIGITIEYCFFNKRKVQPVAYLSESHINCLGLSFFLASVKAFNKRNKFFILDDVISGFDTTHRWRFANLLIEKFKEYQIILLTHEKGFFNLISSQMQKQGWLLSNFNWCKEKETSPESSITEIKKMILKKMENNNIDGLENDIKVYQETVKEYIRWHTSSNSGKSWPI